MEMMLFLMMILTSFACLVLSVKHVLGVILILEMLVLVLFYGTCFSIYNGDYYLILFYLVLMVCEGALGLTLLIITGLSLECDLCSLFIYF